MAAGKYGDVQFNPGEQFSSLDSFKDKLWRYEEANYVSFYIRDVKTLQSAIKCGYRVHAYNSDLVYYYVKYCCVRGGKLSKSATSNRSILKRGCPAFIYLKATSDGKYLEIHKLDTNHNHEVSEELFRRLPQRQQQHRKHCTSNGAKNTASQDTISDTLKVNVTAKSPSPPPPAVKIHDSTATAAKLEEKHKASIRILTDDELHLQSIFIQDELMRRDFDLYPDFLFADVSHTLLDINASVYVLMSENAAGEYAVVALGLLVNCGGGGIEPPLDWLLRTFKECNESWNRIRVIATDRDPKIRATFKRHFDRVSFLTCVVHGLRAFERDVMSAKLPLELFHRMAVAQDVDEFDEHRDALRYSSSECALKCFEERWDGCREEWAMGLHLSAVKLLQSTSGPLGSFQQKLKAFVPSLAPSVQSFVDKLFRLLVFVRRDRCKRWTSSSSSSTSADSTSDAASLRYRSSLTNHAFELVDNEMQAIVNVTEMQQRGAADFQLTTADGMRRVTSTRCDCPFNRLLQLPCRHVFDIRRLLGLDAYDVDLCADRWLQSLYRIHCDFLVHEFRSSGCGGGGRGGSSLETTSGLKRKSAHNGVPESSTEEKFQKALHLVTDAAEFVSRLEDDEFQDKMAFLQDMCLMLKAESEAPKENVQIVQNGYS